MPSLIRSRELEEEHSDMNLPVMANGSLLRMGVGAPVPSSRPPPPAALPEAPVTAGDRGLPAPPGVFPRSPGRGSVVPLKSFEHFSHQVSCEVGQPCASGTTSRRGLDFGLVRGFVGV